MSKIEGLQSIDREYLTPKEVAPILGVAPYTINVQAKEDKKRGTNSFGFPIMLIGSRVKIPKMPFIRYMTYGSAGEEGGHKEPMEQ